MLENAKKQYCWNDCTYFVNALYVWLMDFNPALSIVKTKHSILNAAILVSTKGPESKSVKKPRKRKIQSKCCFWQWTFQ